MCYGLLILSDLNKVIHSYNCYFTLRYIWSVRELNYGLLFDSLITKYICHLAIILNNIL